MADPKSAELPVHLFRDAAAWDAWLAKRHSRSAGLWLRIAKAGSNVTTVSDAEALDVALCYGWIDGQKKTFDEAAWLQKFTPRGTSRAADCVVFPEQKAPELLAAQWLADKPPQPTGGGRIWVM